VMKKDCVYSVDSWVSKALEVANVHITRLNWSDFLCLTRSTLSIRREGQATCCGHGQSDCNRV